VPPQRRIRRAATLAVVALAAVLVAVAWLEEQVRATTPPDLSAATSTLVLDRTDRLLRAFTVADGRWRLPVTIDGVDPLFIDMLLAYEDKRFFAHPGVDARAMLRAAGQALRHGRIVSGGSTLTMQVVRLASGEPTRAPAGKWRQMLGALALERTADKALILNAYLHLAPYGGNLEGVRAASLAWLGKEPARLTPAQAALLVALPQSPAARRPDQFPDAARDARERVLARAEQAGVIDADTAAAARREPLPRQRRPFPMLAAHSARRALGDAPEAPVHRLTIDAGLQARLEALAGEHARMLGEGLSAALLVADHANGEVLASVGSAGLLERGRDGFVDMTRAPRSPGSTLKPLIYGLAFERGLAHPETLIEDRPSAFAGYAPDNFDRGHQGTVTVRRALQESLNVPAVAVLDAVGPARLIARLRRAGASPRLPGAEPAGLAIGLGGVGVSLRDLVAVYAAIARGGRPVALRLSRNGPAATAPGVQPALDGRAAWYLASILSGAGDTRRAGGDVAFKTGTSYGYRDAWAIGFDGRHVIGVWVGRPDGAAVIGLTGRGAAVPLLRDAFARLGGTTSLPGPPTGVLLAATGDLPPPLRRFGGGVARSRPSAGPDALGIAFPPAGARVDLGLTDAGPGQGPALTLKVRNGHPPFVWLANGRPIAREPYSRSASWRPDGPGFATIAVIDGRGDATRVVVYLE
jgi:penicillin-binding protein 1C